MTEPDGAATGPLTVLSAGAAALARSNDLDAALAVIVEAGAAATGAPVAALFSSDPDRSRLELLLTLGMADDQASRLRVDGRRGRRAPDPSRGARSDGLARAVVDGPGRGAR